MHVQILVTGSLHMQDGMYYHEASEIGSSDTGKSAQFGTFAITIPQTLSPVETFVVR